MRTRAVLLDRDGTLIEDRHYLAAPEGVTLLPGVGEALALLQGAGCRLFMVSNQSGIGRGYFEQSAVQACQKRLDGLLADFGVRLADAVWCPHTPEDDCPCRKPRLGLWRDLAERCGLTAATSVMIGDKRVDLEFGCNAGMPLGILVLTGKGRGEALDAGLPLPGPDGRPVPIPGFPGLIAPDMLSAARWLVEHA